MKLLAFNQIVNIIHAKIEVTRKLRPTCISSQLHEHHT